MSRTIGDIDAKLKVYGGNPKCIVCKPDIKEFDISEEDDFVMLGCTLLFLIQIHQFMNNHLFQGDGIFDKQNN